MTLRADVGYGASSSIAVDSTTDQLATGLSGGQQKGIQSNGRSFIGYRKQISSVHEPFVAYSDNGSAWSKVQVASITTDNQRVPSLDVGSDGTIHIVWYGKDPSNTGTDQRQIKYAHSTDNGISWSSWVSVGGDVTGYSGSTLWQEHPDIAVDASTPTTLYVTWEGRDNVNSFQCIKFSKSTDGGVTWSAYVNIGASALPGSRPQLRQTNDGHLHILYYSTAGSTGSVLQPHHTISTDGGATWSSPVIIGNTGYDARNTSMIAIGNVLHAVWRAPDATYTYPQVQYSAYTGTWSAPVAISPSQLYQFAPQIELVNGAPCVVFFEDYSADGYPSENGTAGTVWISALQGGTWTRKTQLTIANTDVYPQLIARFQAVLYTHGTGGSFTVDYMGFIGPHYRPANPSRSQTIINRTSIQR